jgi:cystathionine gamma-synthase
MNDATTPKKNLPKKQKPSTIAAQGLGWIDEATHGVTPGIAMSSTFVRDRDNVLPDGRLYARADNPAFDQPEAVLAALEGGSAAMIFGSGMAAATCAFSALMPPDHLVAPKIMYWALRNWLVTFCRPWGLNVDLVDMTNLDEVKRAVVKGKTKLVWVETPANPLWDVTDIAAVAEIAHAAGARLIVDSTCATPVLTRPIELGADVVMHSATKYLNGHSDLVAGALATKVEDEYWERVKALRSQTGGVLGSFESWLLMRGMRTLFPRVKTQVANAQIFAERMAAHPGVAKVLYPGLADFAGHAVAAKQMKGGYGAMMSVRVKGGAKAALATIANLHVWKRATSLGGVESLVEHRATLEGPDGPVPPDLLRLSVGIEDVNDLIADFEQALEAARALAPA